MDLRSIKLENMKAMVENYMQIFFLKNCIFDVLKLFLEFVGDSKY